MNSIRRRKVYHFQWHMECTRRCVCQLLKQKSGDWLKAAASPFADCAGFVNWFIPGSLFSNSKLSSLLISDRWQASKPRIILYTVNLIWLFSIKRVWIAKINQELFVGIRFVRRLTTYKQKVKPQKVFRQ